MRRVALVLLLAPVLAGCTAGGATSTGDFKGDERDVADQIADFSNAAGRKEESKACSEQLSKALVEKVAEGGKSCASELGKVFDDAEGGAIEIDDITITGSSATADVSIADRDDTIESTFELVDEDGDWRIDSFGTASTP